MALTDKLTAIGNAIRSKTGGSELLTLDEMPQEIQSIQTGGGGTSDTSLADSIIDGTITSYSSDTLTVVANRPFYANKNLKSFTAPLCTSIGAYAFNQSGLETIDAPSVTEIQNYAFNGCTSLVSVNFPELLETGTYIFYNCSSLTSVNLPKATELGASDTYYTSMCFYGCSKLTTVNIPMVQKLGENCFYGCSLLPKIDLSSVTGIGSYVFYNNTALETVILRSTTLVTLGNKNSFNGTKIASGTGYIYVPSALLEQYKVATNWATYANQFRAIEDYPEICGGES